MQAPIVNLNGTSAEALIDQQCEVGRMALALLEALGNAAPNGRDYQTVGAEKWHQAKREHDERVSSVLAIRKNAERLAIAIDEQT